jgi:hypothetical protein
MSSNRIRRDLIAIAAVGVALFTPAVIGVVTSNDGGHFAASRSLVRYGTLDLRDGYPLAVSDISVGAGGRLYANRPPGLAVVLAPFYALGTAADAMLRRPIGDADVRWHRSVADRFGDAMGYEIDLRRLLELQSREVSEQLSTCLAAVLAGTLCCQLTYLLAVRAGVSGPSALAAALALAACTLLWRYSTATFSHAFVACLLLLQLLVVLAPGRSPRRAAALGLLLAADLLLEHQALSTVPVVVAAFVLRPRMLAGVRAWVALLAPLLGAAVALAWMQDIQFGSPLRSAVVATTGAADAGSLGNVFGGTPRSAVWFLLLSPFVFSLASTSPVLLAGLAGLRRLPPRLLVLIAALVASQWVPLLYKTVTWGGLTVDHRYLLKIVPLLALPLGFALDRALALAPWRRRLAVAALAALAAVSTGRVIWSLATFGSHAAALDGFRQPGEASASGLGDVLDAAFPSHAAGGLLLLAAVLAGVATFVLTRSALLLRVEIDGGWLRRSATPDGRAKAPEAAAEPGL